MRGTLGDLVEILGRENWPPVFVVTGDDLDGRSRAVQAVVSAIPAEDRLTAVERLPARPAAAVFDAGRTAPLWGGRRVVIVPDCDWLTPDGDESAQEALTGFAQHSPGTATLVLVADKADRRLAAVKAVEEHGFLLECNPPRERDMPGWLVLRARERGMALTAEAAQALADAVGVDTAVAAREIDKLALLTPAPGDRPAPVGPDLVEQSLGPGRAAGAFALEDAILGARATSALEALDRHLAGADSGTPLALLGRLAAVTRRLALSAGVVGRGGGEAEVQKALGVHPFVAAKYSAAARRLGRRADRGMAACVVADGMLKSGRDARAALAGVVLALAAEA